MVLVAKFSQLDTGSAIITPVLEEVSGENRPVKVQVMQINKLYTYRLSVEGNSLLNLYTAIALPVNYSHVTQRYKFHVASVKNIF